MSPRPAATVSPAITGVLAPTKAARIGLDASAAADEAAALAAAAAVPAGAPRAAEVARSLAAAGPIAPYDFAGLSTAIEASLAAAQTLAAANFAKLSARLDAYERKSSSSGSSPLPSGSESNTGSDDSSDEGASHDSSIYLPLSRDNPHYVAKEFRDEMDQRPIKRDLYGYKPYMVLTGKDSRHENGGLLGVSLTYTESIVAHQWEAQAELFDILGGLGATKLRTRLRAVFETQGECYRLLNEHRQLVVEKVRSISASATTFDKEQYALLEQTFREREHATADMPEDIASIKADFAKSAHRARMHTLAKKAGSASTGGGGGDGGGTQRNTTTDGVKSATRKKKTRKPSAGGGSSVREHRKPSKRSKSKSPTRSRSDRRSPSRSRSPKPAKSGRGSTADRSDGRGGGRGKGSSGKPTRPHGGGSAHKSSGGKSRPSRRSASDSSSSNEE